MFDEFTGERQERPQEEASSAYPAQEHRQPQEGASSRSNSKASRQAKGKWVPKKVWKPVVRAPETESHQEAESLDENQSAHPSSSSGQFAHGCSSAGASSSSTPARSETATARVGSQAPTIHRVDGPKSSCSAASQNPAAPPTPKVSRGFATKTLSVPCQEFFEAEQATHPSQSGVGATCLEPVGVDGGLVGGFQCKHHARPASGLMIMERFSL